MRITGGTGYIGRRLIPLLITRGHAVTAVVRHGSELRVASNGTLMVADPLREDSYRHGIAGEDTFVHLIGTPHPSPDKARLSRSRSRLHPRGNESGERGNGAAFRLRERCASGADHEGIHCRAQRRRGDDPRQRHDRHLSSSVACAGAGTSLGLCAAASLLSVSACRQHVIQRDASGLSVYEKC